MKGYALTICLFIVSVFLTSHAGTIGAVKGAKKAVTTAGDAVASAGQIARFSDKTLARVSFNGKVSVYPSSKSGNPDLVLSIPDRKLTADSNRPVKIRPDETDRTEKVIELIDGQLGSGNGGTVRWNTKGELRSIDMKSQKNDRLFDYGLQRIENGKYSVRALERSAQTKGQLNSNQSEFQLETGETLESVTKIDFQEDDLVLELVVVKNGTKAPKKIRLKDEAQVAAAAPTSPAGKLLNLPAVGAVK